MLVSSPLEAPLPPPPNVLPDLTQDVNPLVANLFVVAKLAREGLLKTLIQPQRQEASSSWAYLFRKTKEETELHVGEEIDSNTKPGCSLGGA